MEHGSYLQARMGGFPWVSCGIVPLLLSAALACCSKDDEGDTTELEPDLPAGVEILEPGSGEASDEPLWPMRVGVRYAFEEGGQWAVLRHSDRFGKPLLYEQVTHQAHPFATSFDYDQGRSGAYWSNEPGGLVLNAAESQLELEDKILVLPAHVKDGMKWVTRGGDGSVLLEGRVTGGEVRETKFGARRVWKVQFTTQAHHVWSRTLEGATKGGILWFMDRFTQYFDGAMWAELPRGLSGLYTWAGAWEQEFIEGRGPANATLSIVPLADSKPNLPPRTQLPADPLAVIETFAETTAFSVIENSVTGDFQVTMGAFYAGAVPEEYGATPPTNARYCYRTSAWDVFPDETGTACQDAAVTVFGAEGYRLSAPMEADGNAPTADWMHDPSVCIAHMAGVLSPNRGLDSELFVRDLWAWGGICPAGNGGWHVDLGHWATTWGFGRVRRFEVLEPAKDEGTALVFHSATPPLWTNLGWLGHGRVGVRAPDVSWAMRNPSLDQPDVDTVTTVLRADNTRELYQVSEDGLIWRLEIEGDVLTRRLLVALELPVDHQTVGVVPVAPGTLQVWVQKGKEFGACSAVGMGSPLYAWLDQASHHIYNVPIDESAVAAPFPLVQGLHVAASGRDVRLCAPRGHTIPTEGWRLGGAPTRGFAIDEGRCALLVREFAPGDPLELSAADAWLIQGSLPDVGEVEIALAPQPGETIPTDLRPSPDGAVGRDSHADSKLALLEWTTTDYYYFFPDPQSDGAWRIEIIQKEPGAKLTVVAGHYAWGATKPVYHDVPFELPNNVPVPDIHYTADGQPAITVNWQEYILDAELGLLPAPPTTTPSDRLWLPTLQQGFQAESGVPVLWRSEGPTGELLPVGLPNSYFMSGITVGQGACAADGACFLLLGGEDASGNIAWVILRADDVSSGLHEVTRGTAASPLELSRLFVDADLLTIVGSTAEGEPERVVWRGSRNVEPTTCDGCSAQEECLAGFCDCAFGAITLDGICVEGVPDTSYLSCADALLAGVGPTELVWIDGDDNGPSPRLITHCNDPEGWTPMPPSYDLLTAKHAESNECAPGLPGFGDDPFMGITSSAALHGEFEVRLGFLTATEDPIMTRDTVVMLVPLDKLVPNGVMPDVCSLGSGAPADVLSFRYQFTGTKSILADGFGDTFKTVAPDGDEVEILIERDSDGYIHLSLGGAEVWKTSAPHWAPYRIVSVGDKRTKLNSVRWLGLPPDFCPPQCDGRNCGDDGCGGLCGVCGANASCIEGVCECDHTFVGDGLMCEADIGGSPELPAASCAEALANKATASTWYPFAWVDQDGPGAEPVFEQICEVDSPSTKPPAGTLGLSNLFWDPTTQTCQLWSTLSPPIGSPLCWTTGVCGDSVPAGTYAAASYYHVRNQFEVKFQFTPGPQGQQASLTLEPLESFDPTNLSWTGWHPECGLTVATTQRITVTSDGDGVWVTVGTQSPELLVPAAQAGGVYTLQRAETLGPLNLMDSQGSLLWQHQAPLPASMRAAGVVEGGGATNVNVVSMARW